MKSRFKPDANTLSSAKQFIDPESFDATEQQFAASLESNPSRFVINPENSTGENVESATENLGDSIKEEVGAVDDDGEGRQAHVDPLLQSESADSWRQEVASKVSSYRKRHRTKAPRYPSLQLKFEPVEIVESRLEPPTWTTSAPNLQATVVQADPPQPLRVVPEPREHSAGFGGAKILEFPHPVAPSPTRTDELADPVNDALRILEVPEILPPPPALGGILIEPTEQPSHERRPGFELPLQAAPMTRRIIASTIDTALVLTGFSLFAYVFFRMTAIVPPTRLTAAVSAGLIFLFWAGYQYLLLVYSGSTPGLKLAKLRLSRFDGNPVPRRIRRWRVVASVLSGLSLGLGYAWCFLDEDELCWHDRITRTYMAPKAPS